MFLAQRINAVEQNMQQAGLKGQSKREADLLAKLKEVSILPH
jgi:hypothetical protein